MTKFSISPDRRMCDLVIRILLLLGIHYISFFFIFHLIYIHINTYGCRLFTILVDECVLILCKVIFCSVPIQRYWAANRKVGTVYWPKNTITTIIIDITVIDAAMRSYGARTTSLYQTVNGTILIVIYNR